MRTPTTLLLAALTLAACGPSPDPRVFTDDSGDVGVLADNHADFGFDLLRAAASDPSENVIMSPLSISAAFGMTELGARGTNQAQMRDVLNITLDEQTYHPLFGALIQDLAGEHHRPFELAIANRLFAQQDFSFEQAYLDACADDYGAPVELLDLGGDPEGARAHINDWVLDNTRERIDQLLPPGALSGNSRLVLVNAIAYLGDWKTPFETSLTAEGPFTLADGSTVQARLMNGTVEGALYTGDDVTVVQLPYAGDELSFVAIMPDDPAGVPELEASLDAATLDTWIGSASRSEELEVALPTFELQWETTLKDPLVALGMTEAFAEGADFTGMTSTPVHVDEAYHQAFIRVDEAGTEAAAATAVVSTEDSDAPPGTARITQPFVYVIRDDLTGSVLFLGRVMDPTSSPLP